MTRLSIIDLETGKQPMWIGDEVGLVFNGEIYNYKEIRAELEAEGVAFSTHSDTEVILKLYYHRGLAALKALDGMYGICLLDLRQRKAYLVRDRIGIKPLYYGTFNDRFYFCSEIKGILAALPIRPTPNFQALHHYLSLRYVPMPETVWSGVQKLRPGHLLEYDLTRDTFEVRRYWRMTFDAQPIDPSRNYQREFEDLFLGSVEAQLLAADVPVGAFLSGGLDSSAICAAAVELGHRNFHTFSVAFKGESTHSELSYARLVADTIGTDHHEVELTIDDFTATMVDVPWYSDEPLADPTTAAVFCLSREARRYVKAVLSGEGADEMLAGYQADQQMRRADSVRARRSWIPRWLARTAASALPTSHPRHRALKMLAAHGWQGYLRSSYASSGWYFDETDKAALWRDPRPLNSTRDLIDAGYGDIADMLLLDQLQTRGCRDWLVEDLLMKADKMSMAASLESRVPFLSNDLMAWCATLPVYYKVGDRESGYTTKKILRDFACRRLPAEILTRKKMGFPLPVYDWFATTLREWSYDIIIGQGTLDDWFDREALVSQYETALAGGHYARNKIFILLTLALWKRRWL